MPESVVDVLGGEQKVPVKEKIAPDKAELTAEQFVTHVQHMQMISTKASEPIRLAWDRSWGLYNNAYDFSNKAEWQSKNFIPRLNMTVRSATYMIKRALLGPAKPYTTEGVGDFGKMVAYYADKITMHNLEEANYVTGVTDSLHAGLLSNLMILKVYPVYVPEESAYWTDPTSKPTLSVSAPLKLVQYKRLKVRVDPVDPYRVSLDPTGQRKYIIEDIDMDLYDLMDIASDPANGYDLAEVKKIQEDYTSSCNENPAQKAEFRAGQAEDATHQRRARTVFVQEYHGDVWTADGKLVERNVVYAVANKKYLIRPPVKIKVLDPANPWPYVISPVVRKPFSVWHQGFTEIVSGIQVMMTELMNLMLDANLFASAKAFEVDIDQVYDPLEFLQGIAPGKTFKKRGGGFNTTPMIKEISIGQVAQQSLSIYGALDREFQSGIGLNEFSMPTAPRGGRTTATEVIEKSQSAATFMEEIAKTTEETCLEPLIKKIFHYVVEYQLSFEDPYTIDLFGSEEAAKLGLMMRNPAFRRAMHTAPLKFKSRGLSASMSKLRDLEKIATLSKSLQPYPELLAMIDPQKALRKIIESMGWYPQDILKDLEGPPVRPTLMPSAPMPTTPISDVGDLSGFLGSANAGMSQVPGMA